MNSPTFQDFILLLFVLLFAIGLNGIMLWYYRRFPIGEKQQDKINLVKAYSGAILCAVMMMLGYWH